MAYKILAVGEVLWDMLPSGKQLGGAPANFTFQCRTLGADARLVTRIGDDSLGAEVLDRFRSLGLPTDAVQVDPEAPTGTVDVTLDGAGVPHYTIRAGVAWDRIEVAWPAREAAAAADALCFGSLAQRDEPSRSSIRALVGASRAGSLRIFDVNLRAPFIDRAIIEESLGLANALKLNDEELPQLAAMFGLPEGTREAIAALAGRFGLSLVALTRGPGGSLLMAGGSWSDHPGVPAAVRDTVGAGDAFTAALVVGTLAGRPLDAINEHANEVAAYVCSQPGGTPALPDKLKILTKPSPEVGP
ncbi:Fructosamine kinase FrlD [Aquisphaera giovannonii]|uniref:Fructosamine kinase FrlD n=1 Tax=Aquisphaera giovannonii TaxID=406548 RepID=A0A5B9WC80_9BACT|nr:carbohydrate kinase [Aquisphaera giovannonii]QEH38278.1 Fructosamine kinase FrlD [Aquisphaera giovannonii]